MENSVKTFYLSVCLICVVFRNLWPRSAECGQNPLRFNNFLDYIHAFPYRYESFRSFIFTINFPIRRYLSFKVRFLFSNPISFLMDYGVIGFPNNSYIGSYANYGYSMLDILGGSHNE